MSGPWAVVLVVGVATVGIKASGPLLLQGRRLPPAAEGLLALLAPALLAALVATQTFGAGQHLTVDARAAGLAVAVGALLLRAPLLVAVVLAAVVAALLRLHG